MTTPAARPTKRVSRAARFGAAVVPLTLSIVVSACASRGLKLPEGAGAPFPEFQQAFAAASAGCQDVRTLTAEAGVSGDVGGAKVRGRVIAGFEAPGRMRLEAVAPVGPPVFILTADGPGATLLMPRASEVLKGEPPERVLEALVGVSLRPDDLRAIFAGCITPGAVPTGGRQFDAGWARVDLEGGSAAYLHQEGGVWRIRAGLRPLLSVEYEFASNAAGAGPTPKVVRLRSAADGGPGANLRLALSQVETNAAIAVEAFAVSVPSNAVPITLAELQQAGPFGQRR